MDKKYFAQLSGIPVTKINGILKGENYLVTDEGSGYKVGTILRRKKDDKETDWSKFKTGVVALNEMAENLGFKATQDVYVLPYYMRQDPPEGEGKHPLNSLYNYLITSRKNPDRQQRAYEQLLNNRNIEKPLKGKTGFAIDSLSDQFKGKKGIMRAYMSGRRIAYSGSAVLTPDVRMEYGDIAIPASIACNIYKPTLKDRLMQEGKTEAEAEEWLSKFTNISEPASYRDLQELSLYVRESGMKCIVNRAPSLHAGNLLAFKPRISRDNTIKMCPLNFPSFNADIDGDKLVVFGINDLRIVDKTKEIDADSDAGTLLPRHKDTKLTMPQKEAVFGLINILNNRSDSND